MTEGRKGLLFGAAAYVMWGLFPLYWPLVRPAGALEILAHRVVWSLVVVIAILVVQRNWRWIRELLHQPGRLGLMALGAILIATNWGVYIWGVNHGEVVETSLGYFINPLVTVLLGVLVLREHLRPVQWAAVGLGALSVLVLAVDYGHPPWIALTLAFSFGSYGLIKKHVGAPASHSLTVETATLLVPSLVYLGFLAADGRSSFGHSGAAQAVLLIGAGVVTAVPLLFFAGAARRLPLVTLGLLQYVTPVMQFAFGVLVFHEPMPALRLMGFALVWVALIVLSVDMVRYQRTAREVQRQQGVEISATSPV
jgi:chloramphenicol-sensitive protein RarD